MVRFLLPASVLPAEFDILFDITFAFDIPILARLMVLDERKLFWAEFAVPDGYPDKADARRFMRSALLFLVALWALSIGALLNMGLAGGSGVG